MDATVIVTDLDSAVTYLSKTGTTYPAMAKRYGADWRKWPQGSNWWKALNAISQARTQATAPPPPSPPPPPTPPTASTGYGVSPYGEAVFS